MARNYRPVCPSPYSGRPNCSLGCHKNSSRVAVQAVNDAIALAADHHRATQNHGACRKRGPRDRVFHRSRSVVWPGAVDISRGVCIEHKSCRPPPGCRATTAGVECCHRISASHVARSKFLLARVVTLPSGSWPNIGHHHLSGGSRQQEPHKYRTKTELFAYRSS